MVRRSSVSSVSQDSLKQTNLDSFFKKSGKSSFSAVSETKTTDDFKRDDEAPTAVKRRKKPNKSRLPVEEKISTEIVVQPRYLSRSLDYSSDEDTFAPLKISIIPEERVTVTSLCALNKNNTKQKRRETPAETSAVSIEIKKNKLMHLNKPKPQKYSPVKEKPRILQNMLLSPKTTSNCVNYDDPIPSTSRILPSIASLSKVAKSSSQDITRNDKKSGSRRKIISSDSADDFVSSPSKTPIKKRTPRKKRRTFDSDFVPSPPKKSAGKPNEIIKKCETPQINSQNVSETLGCSDLHRNSEEQTSGTSESSLSRPRIQSGSCSSDCDETITLSCQSTEEDGINTTIDKTPMVISPVQLKKTNKIAVKTHLKTPSTTQKKSPGEPNQIIKKYENSQINSQNISEPRGCSDLTRNSEERTSDTSECFLSRSRTQNRSSSLNSDETITSSCQSTEEDDINTTVVKTPTQLKKTNKIAVRTPLKTPNTAQKKISPKRTSINMLADTPNKRRIRRSLNFEEENEVDNPRFMKYFRMICRTLQSENLLKLLRPEEQVVLEKFSELGDMNYQIFCCKLFTRLQKWYNVFDFCANIKLDMDKSTIKDMYQRLKALNFIETDFSEEHIHKLLSILKAPEIKDICGHLRIKTKINKKDHYINKLLHYCNDQSALSEKKTEEVLREYVYKKLGLCVKLSNILYYTFYKIYVLYGFTNPDLIDPHSIHLFLSRISTGEIVLPKYRKTDVTLFYTKEEFMQFSKAYECKTELLKAIDRKNRRIAMELCTLAFSELKGILSEKRALAERSKFLLKFTAGAKYASVLNTGAEYLFPHYKEEVFNWLQLLLEQKTYCQYKKGRWYDMMSKLQINYYKKIEDGIQTLMMGLEDEEISTVTRNELSRHAEILIRNKQLKMDKLDRDKLSFLTQPVLNNFPETEIDAKARRSNVRGKKRIYETRNSSGERTFMSVEEIAINHYRTYGFSGIHCENSLLTSLFFILFWDIIYEKEVEGAFISHVQTIPLDLYTDDFYKNRKPDIDKRLEEISRELYEQDLLNFLKETWQDHKGEKSLISQHLFKDAEMLQDIVMCIGRGKLSKMLKRLIESFATYHSGMPDLFLWNVDRKSSKFVEVKGENDKLSVKQILWLNFLQSIEVDVEVCHVHSKGSKRKKLKKRVSGPEA